MTIRRTVLLPLVAASIAALLAGVSLSRSAAAASDLKLPSPQHCAATMSDWMDQQHWPAEEVLLGDQIYSRSRLWNLNHSQGNSVADLGLALATTQLNLAAGAEPSTDVVDALFEADQWMLDSHEESRRSQQDTKSLSELSQALNSFNTWAAQSAECSN